jgi:hypothetical protein
MLSACLGPWDPEWSVDVDGTAGETGAPDTDTPPDTTPPLPTGDTAPTGPIEVEVDEPITSNTTWTADRIWVLKQIIYVEANSVLTVEPGTQVQGDIGSALVVTKGSRLVAQGTAVNPVVFTSYQPVGQRASGNWGGVVLLGEATVAGSPPWQIEGLEDAGFRGEYGGIDDNYNCGRLEYVRIEFAGYEAFPGNELNGLTLGGCGVFTYIQNVQVHRGFDDGVEMFGGTVDLKNIIVSAPGDDSFDWDEGWRGRGQFLISQQYPLLGDKAFEGDGIIPPKGEDEPLQSKPRLYNVSLFATSDEAFAQGGLHLREDTGAEIRNLLVAWQTGRGIDIDDVETTARVASGDLVVSHSIFYTNVANPVMYNDPPGKKEDNDGGFDERAWLLSEPTNLLDEDPLLTPPPAADQLPWNVDPAVHWIPPLTSAAISGYPVQSEDGFWDVVSFMGAVAPGTASPWWEPWAAFPEN